MSEPDLYLESINNYFKGAVTLTDSLQQFIDQENKGNRISTNITYTEPVGKGMLQFNYNPSWTTNKADQKHFIWMVMASIQFLMTAFPTN